MTLKTITKTSVRSDVSLLVAGITFIVISGLIFMLPEWGKMPTESGSFFAIFWLNYGFAFLYFVMLLSMGRNFFRKFSQNIEHVYLLLVLAIISCFSLNRQMSIFQDSAMWLEVCVTVFCATLMLYSFRQYLPALLNQVLVFILGAGAMLWVYFACYLMPYYAISIFGFLALGISIHTYVPLFILVCLGFGLKKAVAQNRQFLRCFAAGAAFPVLFMLFFLVQWQQRNAEINFYSNDFIIEANEELPRWVKISQLMPADYLTERLMKTDLVYQIPTAGFSVWEMPDTNFEEVKQHDPLVMLAVLIFGEPNLDKKEKVKILESMYDARHQAEQRLWSGNSLSTANVISQVELYPEYRLAYTEKVLSIQNNSPSSWSEQEAIYTFYMPEGSVVSSLSLWINGVEEKGYLTTKGKATTAYNTIVGREARDPSVVHWQEGNRVSVRVFPCTPSEIRLFKIGITSPLRQNGDELVYENVYFTGPSAASASETSVVHFSKAPQQIDLPYGYKQLTGEKYKRQGNYVQDWAIKMQATEIASSGFTFANNNYRLVPVQKRLEKFEPQTIILDINTSWTDSDLAEVWEAVKEYPVYVWNGSMQQLHTENKDRLAAQLQQQQFSLFPLHKLKNPDTALIISKSNGTSPNLSDLKETPFAFAMADEAQLHDPVRVFSLGNQLSPYFKSLKELRVLTAMHGSTQQLQQLLSRQQFIATKPTPNTVALGDSGLGIIKTEAAIQGNAPDHLLRLYAYNHLLQQIGPRYFCKDFQEEELIAEAAQANIVTPLSSLIVLETQADYERFDIQKSKDSLGNASINGAGAVPEPAEWALIILAILVIGTVTLKPYFLR